MTLLRPMVVWPEMVTLLWRRVPGPMTTSGPMTQKGPISTSGAIWAFGSTAARGEIFISVLNPGEPLPTTFPRTNAGPSRLGINEHEFNVGLGGQLVLNECLAADVTGAAFDADSDSLED